MNIIQVDVDGLNPAFIRLLRAPGALSAMQFLLRHPEVQEIAELDAEACRQLAEDSSEDESEEWYRRQADANDMIAHYGKGH